MHRLWKVLLAVLSALILIATTLYAGSLDWQYQHSKHVAALPLLEHQTEDGHYRIEANGLTFNARLYGRDNAGDAIVMLHGFPEMSLMWEPLAIAAAEEGLRVVAFDQRGYSPGARPKGAQHYALATLATDVIAIADAVGYDDFHLVGHDWGSVVGWVVAQGHPDRLKSWTAMAIPHTGLFLHSALHNEDQRERSSYIDLLRLPVLPEFLSMAAGQWTLRDFLDRLPPAHRPAYLSLMREPGAMTAMLNWYRALDPEALLEDKTLLSPVTVPTLFIRGHEDPVVAESVIAQQPRFIHAPYKEIVLPTGHSIIQQAPGTVTEQVLAHIQSQQ